MTPEQTALARELAEHPCWPLKRKPSTRGFRCDDGIRWVFPGHGEMLPDLCDAATAGVLLDMLPKVGAVIRRETETLVAVPPVLYRGDCLGEACARALLALWKETTP